MKILFKSLGRGCQTERVLAPKCDNGFPKVSRNLIHVIKIENLQKSVICSKPSMGLVVYYAFLHQFRKIPKLHEIPWKWSGNSYYFSDSEQKSVLDWRLQTLHNPCCFYWFPHGGFCDDCSVIAESGLALAGAGLGLGWAEGGGGTPPPTPITGRWVIWYIRFMWGADKIHTGTYIL